MIHPALIAATIVIAVPLALAPTLACADDQIERDTQQLRQFRLQYEQQEMKQRLEEVETRSKEREDLESLRSLPVVPGPLKGSEAYHSPTSALPTFPKNTRYGDARTALTALGYQPVKLPDADKCDPAYDSARCFPERQACAGTGLAQCSFVWRRTERVIIVGTIGDDPKVASVRCLSGCQ